MDKLLKKKKSLTSAERLEKLCIVYYGDIEQAENIVDDYLKGDIDSYHFGTDLVTNLVSRGKGTVYDVKFPFGCQKLLERIVTSKKPETASASEYIGTAVYALRELAEKFHYAKEKIKMLGDKCNQNNATREYFLSRLTFIEENKPLQIEFYKEAV